MKTFTDERGNYKYHSLLSQDKPWLTINFYDLYNYNDKLAIQLIEQPFDILNKIKEVLRKKGHIRNLIETTPIRLVNSDHIGQFIQVQGIITKARSDTSKMTQIAWKCEECNEINLVDQDEQFRKKPVKCSGCDSRKFSIDFTETTFQDHQIIHIQEPPDQLPSGEMPISLKVELNEELVKLANPGDRAIITGIIRTKQEKPSSSKLELERYFEANHIEIINKEVDIITFSEEEIKEITELSKRENLFDLISGSIYPELHGWRYVKKAITLQLAGGIRKKEELTFRRGDIHVFLIGDPGIGKSQLLVFTSKLSSRGVLATGGGATKVGLLAAAVKEDGEFVIEAGALVLADKGICCIDEVDKVNEQDRNALHRAMEQQEIRKDAGGKHLTLNARCAILAAANPIHGRYEPSLNIAENLKDFSVTLLSRFDLIFVMRDNPDETEDRNVAKKILGTLKTEVTPLSSKLLKRYFSYCKTIEPKMTEGLMKYLEEYYVNLRKKPSYQKAIAITPRQIESLIRLVLAHARLHLKETATMDDATAAIMLFERSMNDVGIDPSTGEMDIDMFYSGTPKSLRERLVMTRHIISELSEDNVLGNYVDKEYLIDNLCERWKIGRDEVEKIIEVLERDGVIYYPKIGRIKTT